MPRRPRPSQVYRLEPEPARDEAPASPRRLSWGPLVVLGLVAAAVVGYGSMIAPGSPVPAIDVGTEDDAVTALRLYLAQTQAIDAVDSAARGRRAEVAALQADLVQEALDEARPRFGADAAARAYWGHRDHDRFVATLRAGAPPLPPQPPATLYLELYLRRLPPETVADLRGHPVARAALDRLDAP